MERLYSTAEIAEKTGLTKKRIQQLAPALINLGHAQRIGTVIVCAYSAIAFINSRPETRGRKANKGEA